MSGRLPEGRRVDEQHSVTVRLDRFAREAIDAECDRLGVSAEELIAFAAMYYLADLDSGRVSRTLPRDSG